MVWIIGLSVTFIRQVLSDGCTLDDLPVRVLHKAHGKLFSYLHHSWGCWRRLPAGPTSPAIYDGPRLDP